MDWSTDVLVAGAGPAGATVARLLALRHRRVLLVDPLGPSLERLEILAPAAYPVLEALDLVRLLDEPSVACSCLGIRRRWGTREVRVEDFLNHPGSRGAVVDRSLFDHALLSQARNAGAQFLRGRVLSVSKEGDSNLVTIRHGQSRSVVFARLIVDATGRSASLARRLGANRIFSQRLVAEKVVSASLARKNSTAVWLEVEAHKVGWSYSVAGHGRQESWQVYPAGVRDGGAALDRVDASSVSLSSAAGEGWVAVGDAATSFDPITSQGLVNALSTALVASGAILSSSGSQSEKFEAYSAAVADTFAFSEAGRTEAYRIFG